MDTWGIVIFLLSIVVYYFSKKPFFLFLSGVGAGILIGAVWAMSIIRAAF